MRVDVVLGEEPGNWLADNVGCVETLDALGAGVPALYEAILVEHDDRTVGDAFDQKLKIILGRLPHFVRRLRFLLRSEFLVSYSDRTGVISKGVGFCVPVGLHDVLEFGAVALSFAAQSGQRLMTRKY